MSNSAGSVSVQWRDQSGNLHLLISQQSFDVGSIVYEGCLGDTFEAIVLQSTHNNAWVGYVEYKSRQDATYAYMRCENCQGGTGLENTILVTGDTNSNAEAAFVCKNEIACNLVYTTRNTC